jgi:hypothetical protein
MNVLLALVGSDYVEPIPDDSRHVVATKLIVEREIRRPHVVCILQGKRLHASPSLEEADYCLVAIVAGGNCGW